MLSVSKYMIDDESKLVRYNLNYPVIEYDKESDIVSYINESIHQDILSFKDVVYHEICNSRFKIEHYIFNAVSEYRVTFNIDNIISIPIEFSQLVGLYDITYINCYNYDIDLGKRIKLKDIFKEDCDYIGLINNKIIKIISGLKKKYKNIIDDETVYNDDNFLGIDEDQDFYIEKDGIVICFSSYEINHRCSYLTEFKILFDDQKEYLSEYTINSLCKELLY